MKNIPWVESVGTRRTTRSNSFLLTRLGVLWLVALLPRLIVVAFFFQYPIALDDMFQYDMLARSLESGHGYRWYSPADIAVLRPYLQQVLDLSQVHPPPDGFVTTFRPPGYPFFLAGIYLLVPTALRFGYVRIIQVMLTAFMAPLVMLLGLSMGLSKRAATLAGIAMALYPILVFYPVGLASEDLFIPLVLVSFILLLRIRQKPGTLNILFTGLVLGFTMLTRSVVAGFVILAGIWAWRFSPTGKKVAFLLVGTAFAVCLPWSVRNSLIMGKPTFVESSMGFQAYIGYNPAGDGGFISQIAIPPMSILDDAKRDQYTTAAALSFIKNDPWGSLARVFRRSAFFLAVEDRELTYFYGNGFFGDIPQPWLGLIYFVFVAPWVGLGLCAIAGFRLLRNRAVAWLVIALVVGYTLPHLLIIAEPRFHLALVPVLLPIAFGMVDRPREALQLVLHQHSWRTWIVRFGLLLFLALVIWAFALHWERFLAVMGPHGYQARLYY